MDNTLYCILNMTTATQDIYFGDNDDPQSIAPVANCETRQLMPTLTELARAKQARRIRLFGVKEYIEGLVKNFPIENVEIEVN